MAGLPGVGGLSGHQSGHRSLPFADWRQAEDDHGIHHGEQSSGSPTHSHIDVRIVPVSADGAGFHGRDVFVRGTALHNDPRRYGNRLRLCRENLRAVDLPTAARQRLRGRFVRTTVVHNIENRMIL
jgi:hypothetical protein